LHLLFTPWRSSKARLLRNLPKFPILIDYRLARWKKKEMSLALAALEHHGRVRGISLGTRLSKEPTEVFEAMNRHLPELESLEIGSGYRFGVGGHNFVILPDTFLLGSASSLRRLKLQDAEPRNLSSQLSTLTGLVDLSLTIKVPLSNVPEESSIQSLVTNMQRMSCLRRLELRLTYPLWYHVVFGDNLPRPPPPTGDIVPLPNLMELVLRGDHIYLEALVALLAAPSLQLLNAEFTDAGDATDEGHIPHLCRLICDTEPQFRLVRLDLSDYNKVRFTAETHSKSVHPQPFKISIPRPISLEMISNMLSGPLATVEELVIQSIIGTDERRIVQWRGFLNHTRQVKFLQVPWQLAHDVAHSFQQDNQEPAMDLLPALEQIKMDMTRYYPPLHDLISQNHEAIPDAFNPLIAARKKVGRPITLSFTDHNWMVNAP
jgi:hypothetical protein